MQKVFVIQVGRITRAGNMDSDCEFAVRVDKDVDISDVRKHFEKRYEGLAVKVVEAKVEPLELPAPPCSKDNKDLKTVRVIEAATLGLTKEETTQNKELRKSIDDAERQMEKLIEAVKNRLIADNPWIQDIQGMYLGSNYYSGNATARVILHWNVIEEVTKGGSD
jgi:hypothetical protein